MLGLANLQHLCNSSRMLIHPSRKPGRPKTWPQKVTIGRASVTVYRRKTPSGNWAFMVQRHQGKRRLFESYADEGEALEAAARLAWQLSEQDAIAASISREGAIAYASACQTLRFSNIGLTAAAETIAAAVQYVDLASVVTACKFYSERHKRVVPKRVADVVAELLKIKEARGGNLDCTRLAGSHSK